MNSLQGYFQDASVKGSLSLDRCTFLVMSPSLSLWQKDDQEREINRKRISEMAKLTEKLLKDTLDEDFPQGKPSELFMHHYRISGVDIQFGAVMPKRKKVTDEFLIQQFGSMEDKEKGYMFDYSPNSYAFRVEYNPNETSLECITPLLQYFSVFGIGASSVRIARLDIAIDYDKQINPALCLCSNMRKSFIAIGSTGLETVYFGSRSSKNYIRLYNKAVEILEKDNIDLGHPRWRFELESKDSFTLDSCPDHGKVLERFSFYNGGLISDDWKLELIRAFAKDHGLKAALSIMPSRSAKRYKKLLDEFDQNTSIETPSVVYYREFPLKMKILRCQILTALGHKITEVA